MAYWDNPAVHRNQCTAVDSKKKAGRCYLRINTLELGQLESDFYIRTLYALSLVAVTT
jgi:hypothetical protein